MRNSLTILLLFVYSVSFAKKDASRLVEIFHEALVQKDSNKLKVLIHDGVLYGHSNGWIQNKREIIDDLFNGKLAYQSITRVPYRKVETRKSDDSTIRFVCATPVGMISFGRQVQIVHEMFDYKVLYKGKQLELILAVMFVWVEEKGRWKLLARQSTKIN